jgi:dTDP-4-dehydrorhamnose reductase
VKILLLGGNGQVGWELRRTLTPLGDVVAPTRAECDLEKPEELLTCWRATQPQLVVNAAAYTAVDKAESEPDRAHRINAGLPALLAYEARRAAVPVVHFSTDYVFDGTKVSSYIENDEPKPLGVYGRTKNAGDTAIIDSGADLLCFRTQWVYASRGHNFIRTILRLARQGTPLRVVDDQWGAPTWARWIAEVVALAVQQCQRSGWPQGSEALFHLAPAGSVTWCGLARAALAMTTEPGPEPPPVQAIPTSDYPTPARRPAKVILDTSRLLKVFGLQLPDWKVGLKQCFEEAM